MSSLIRAAVVAPLLAVGLVLLAPLLLVVARTWRGRVFASVVMMPLVLTVWVRLDLPLPPTFWMLIVIFPVYAYAFVVQRYVSNFRGPVGSYYTSRSQRARKRDRIVPGVLEILPETDLIRLGVFLVTRLDPRMSRADAWTVRRVTAGMLRELEGTIFWRVIAPGLPAAVVGLATGVPPAGHYYSYRPEPRPGRRAGLLVALHGHGGNVQLWTHVWRRFADAHGFVIVTPTFGYGNWEHPAGAAVVEECLTDALKRFPEIDPARVYLAGLSQGGCGVGRAAVAMPTRFAGLVFLSATMEPDVLGSPEFAAGWAGRPVLVEQGGKDVNVTPASVERGVAAIRTAGADLTVWLDPDADHFLFFARLDEVQRRIAGWITGERPA